MLLQKQLGGFCQPLHFTPINTFQGRAESILLAVSDLDENQGFTLLHDQIDLSETTGEVALHQLQSVLLKISQCSIFGFLA